MIRPYADNVLICLDPLETKSAGGLHIVDSSGKRKGHRTARVIASGPGYHSIPTYSSPSRLIPNETKAGDRVVVEALAGEDWRLNFSAPRHHETAQEFDSGLSDLPPGEYRVVREAEILAILE